MVYKFQRTSMAEEIVVFASDSHLVLNREEEDDVVHQRVMKHMNRTVISWYYEGLLRIRRLEEKQKRYNQTISR